MVTPIGGAMFFREKKSGSRRYLQIVENRWEDGGSKQRVLRNDRESFQAVRSWFYYASIGFYNRIAFM